MKPPGSEADIGLSSLGQSDNSRLPPVSLTSTNGKPETNGLFPNSSRIYVAGEIISILFRPVSLSFRLYGNTFAGEKMLEEMGRMIPGFGWLLPIPFYFMELLVGFVQALVFMLLTAVFTMLMCQRDEGHELASQ